MQTMINKNIRFVLVNPSHPGNIGSAARAMKNMGLQKLVLVKPKRFPDNEATDLASGANDILEDAKMTQTLDEALKDCKIIFGTSARMREMPQQMMTPKEAAQFITKEPKENEMAFVFGNEQSGLTNEELKRCHYHIRIPTQENFSSLNLAAAVQIIAYEIYQHTLDDFGQSLLHERKDFATANELEGLYNHIEKTMLQIGFLHPNHPRQLMNRMRQILNRARIDRDELNLLRGIMTAILNYTKE